MSDARPSDPLPPLQCPACGSRDVRRARVSHGFHFVLTLVTLGLWLVSWLAVALARRVWPWRCGGCGHRFGAMRERSS